MEMAECCGQQLIQKLGITLKASELEPITQQLTNTWSFKIKINNTTTYTKLGITLEALELESITLKERKLEVISILEEQIQLVLMRVRDKVSRSSIYTVKILLETPMLRYYWKLQCWLRYYWKLQCYCHVHHIECKASLRSQCPCD
jgi:hypothetical protein